MLQMLLRAKFVLIGLALLAPPLSDPAPAQRRPRMEQPPAVALPSSSDDTARCSFAFHDALGRVRDGDAKRLGTLDRVARVSEPGLTGTWLFWVNSAKARKPPPPERVCAERVMQAGRERCLRWQAKPADPAKVQSAVVPPPTPEELAVLKALDGFVTDKGAMLEFGSNGRQYATLQRFATEFGTYIDQPRHPALCTGVPEMLDFHTSNLAGVAKRAAEIAANAGRAQRLAQQRVIALIESRNALARTETGAEPTGRTPAPAVVAPPLPLGLVSPAMLTRAVVDGLISAEQMLSLKDEANAQRLLHRARDLLANSTLPEVPPALRAAAGASLRMIEAASYGALQVARFKEFERVLLGTIGQVRDAHRIHCTCAS